jgi:hypothetical protein
MASGALAQVAVPADASCDLPVKAPATSAHRDLGPDDPGVRTCTIGWWCFEAGMGAGGTALLASSPGQMASDAESLWRDINSADAQKAADALRALAGIADHFLTRSKEPALEFWGVKPWKDEGHDAWFLNPPPGESEEVTFSQCYTAAELEAAKGEALRWARHVRDVFLARKFGTDPAQWPAWIPQTLRSRN